MPLLILSYICLKWVKNMIWPVIMIGETTISPPITPKLENT